MPTRRPLRTTASSLIASLVVAASIAHATEAPKVIFEAYPQDVLASKKRYEQQIARVGSSVGNVPFYLIVPKLQRWTPGQTIRVAFNGGSTDLHEKIAGVANRWVSEGKINLALSFKDTSGKFRSWTTSDASYAAEIRISFVTGRRGGNWSHVGTDSTNANLIGGIPKQASMNLGGFDKELPPGWEATVLHEFGHALGFEHEHQNPESGCDFRFEDDPGYEESTDAQGWHINDSKGRRPGLYTYLGGHANYWPRAKVDSNLKALAVSSAFLVSTFDNDSIMKYLFSSYFFSAGEKSPCFSSLESRMLSKNDVLGAQRAYPLDPTLMASQIDEKRMLLTRVRATANMSSGTKAHATTQLRALPTR